MIRAYWRWILAALGTVVIGCAPKPMVQQKAPPPDPLLVTRKPIEGKPVPSEAMPEARLRPPAPPADDVGSVRGDGSPVCPVQLRVNSRR